MCDGQFVWSVLIIPHRSTVFTHLLLSVSKPSTTFTAALKLSNFSNSHICVILKVCTITVRRKVLHMTNRHMKKRCRSIPLRYLLNTGVIAVTTMTVSSKTCRITWIIWPGLNNNCTLLIEFLFNWRKKYNFPRWKYSKRFSWLVSIVSLLANLNTSQLGMKVTLRHEKYFVQWS